MRTVYLLRQYGMARLEGEQLVVQQRGEEIERVGLPLVDQILVMGNVQLSTPLIRACLQRQIAVVYLNRQGWCHGRLQPLESGYRHRSRYQQQLGGRGAPGGCTTADQRQDRQWPRPAPEADAPGALGRADGDDRAVALAS